MAIRVLRFVIASMVLTFAFALSSAAMQQPHPVEGEYAATASGSEIGTITFTVAIKRAGDKWSCEFKDSPIPIAVHSVTVDADNKISITAEADGQEVSITGKYDGGKIAGAWSVADASGTWSATKKEAKPAQQSTPAASSASIEGTYDAQVIAEGQGTLPFTLIISREGDKLVTKTKDGGPLDIVGIRVEGESVTLSATFQGNPFDLPGKRTASEMGGKWEAGGFTGNWSAKKRASSQSGQGRIEGQFAQDFVAGQVPSEAEIAALEKEIAASPNDFHLVRKLGKGYFFQVFGEGRFSSAAKAQQTLGRALELKKDDAETLSYLGALAGLKASKSKDASERDLLFKQSFETLKKAQELEPNNIAVLSVTGASFLFLPDSFNAAPLAAQAMEKIRRAMGPVFERFSHHGRQRILLTQGQAYARMGQAEKARACFEDGLKVDQESVEAALIKAEMSKLKP